MFAKHRFMQWAAVAICLSWGVLASGQSTRGKAETLAGGKKISINYGRPALEGRDLFSLARPGTVWRLGQNEATEITTELALMAGGTHLDEGKYSLWARKTAADSWTLAFHPRTGIWGLPEMRDGFVGEVPLKLESGAPKAEVLNITLKSSGKDVNIEIHWGTTKLLGTFQTM